MRGMCTCTCTQNAHTPTTKLNSISLSSHIHTHKYIFTILSTHTYFLLHRHTRTHTGLVFSGHCYLGSHASSRPGQGINIHSLSLCLPHYLQPFLYFTSLSWTTNQQIILREHHGRGAMPSQSVLCDSIQCVGTWPELGEKLICVAKQSSGTCRTGERYGLYCMCVVFSVFVFIM